jgi:hypothetical protein
VEVLVVVIIAVVVLRIVLGGIANARRIADRISRYLEAPLGRPGGTGVSGDAVSRLAGLCQVSGDAGSRSAAKLGAIAVGGAGPCGRVTPLPAAKGTVKAGGTRLLATQANYVASTI